MPERGRERDDTGGIREGNTQRVRQRKWDRKSQREFMQLSASVKLRASTHQNEKGHSIHTHTLDPPSQHRQ